MKKLFVVGLGNPGAQYTDNRHNVGQFLVKKLAKERALEFKKHGLNFAAEDVDNGCHITFAYPDQFMNVSGRAVLKLLGGDKKAANHLIVLVDDLETKIGSCQIAFDGGARGHNGVRSIHQELGTKGIFQLRIGIGRPVGTTADISEYVLSDFTDEEQATIENIQGEVDLLLRQWIQGFEGELHEASNSPVV